MLSLNVRNVLLNYFYIFKQDKPTLFCISAKAKAAFRAKWEVVRQYANREAFPEANDG